MSMTNIAYTISAIGIFISGLNIIRKYVKLSPIVVNNCLLMVFIYSLLYFLPLHLDNISKFMLCCFSPLLCCLIKDRLESFEPTYNKKSELIQVTQNDIASKNIKPKKHLISFHQNPIEYIEQLCKLRSEKMSFRYDHIGKPPKYHIECNNDDFTKLLTDYQPLKRYLNYVEDNNSRTEITFSPEGGGMWSIELGGYYASAIDLNNCFKLQMKNQNFENWFKHLYNPAYPLAFSIGQGKIEFCSYPNKTEHLQTLLRDTFIYGLRNIKELILIKYDKKQWQVVCVNKITKKFDSLQALYMHLTSIM